MANTSDGHFVWYELMAADAPAAVQFYGEVDGWKTEAFGDEGYQMWVGSQGPLGGVMSMPDELRKAGVPPHWVGSVQVADVDAIAAQTTKLGGKVHEAPFDIPTVGRYAVLADPQGATFAVFKSDAAMQRHDAAKDGEFCWSELMTSDSAKAWDFYSTLFGWKVLEQMDMGANGSYRIFGLTEPRIGDTRMGGMMTTPKDAPMPPSWIYYTSTHDLDATLKRATKMGAKIINGPMEVPGGGRIAQLLDPQQTMFALHQAPKA